MDETQQGVRATLLPYLDPVEHEALMGEPNKAAQILALPSAHLERLLRRGLIEDFRHMEVQGPFPATRVSLPGDTRPGRYVARAIAIGDGLRDEARVRISVGRR